MGDTPVISTQAFETWPERLREAGYEVDVSAFDEEIGVGVVRKGSKILKLSLLRHKRGGAAILMNRIFLRRSDREYAQGVVSTLQGDGT